MAEIIRNNWRTTAVGVVLAVAGLMQIDPDLPEYVRKIAYYVMIAANASGFVVAADSRSRK